jgi:hypothetical protein
MGAAGFEGFTRSVRRRGPYPCLLGLSGHPVFLVYAYPYILIMCTLLVNRSVILFPLSWLLGARGARCSEYSHGTAACPDRDRSAATSFGSQKGAELAVCSAVAGPLDGTLRGLVPMYPSIHLAI